MGPRSRPRRRSSLWQLSSSISAPTSLRRLKRRNSDYRGYRYPGYRTPPDKVLVVILMRRDDIVPIGLLYEEPHRLLCQGYRVLIYVFIGPPAGYVVCIIPLKQICLSRDQLRFFHMIKSVLMDLITGANSFSIEYFLRPDGWFAVLEFRSAQNMGGFEIGKFALSKEGLRDLRLWIDEVVKIMESSTPPVP